MASDSSQVRPRAIKVVVERDLTELAGDEFAWPSGWTSRSLEELGAAEFAQHMVRAAAGDPFDTSTPESALEDLEELMDECKGFDLSEWLLVADPQGEIGVVLPYLSRGDPSRGMVAYLGVVPERRGQGNGTTLHAYGLHRLAQLGATRYIGSTDTRNVPMRRIFAANQAVARVSRRVRAAQLPEKLAESVHGQAR